MARIILTLSFSILIFALHGQTLAKGPLKMAMQNGTFILDEIARHNVVEGPSVGFAGTASDQYKRFRKWVDFANEDEILRMTDHSNGVVRSYAFWGLMLKDSPLLKEVSANHIDDDDMIQTMFGCIMDQISVYDFMHRVMRGDMGGTARQ